MSDSSKDGHRERLRQRFVAGEAPSRTDEALLELLLCYGIPRRDVQPLARELIQRFGSLDAILALDLAVLRQQAGLGEQSVVLLKLIDWIRSGSSVDPAVDNDVMAHAAGQLQLLTDADGGVIEKPVATVADRTPGGPDEVAAVVEPENREYELPTDAEMPPAAEATKSSDRVVVARPGTGLFGKSMLKEAIDILPRLPETASLDEIRLFLRQNLPFSSEQTRQRNSSYVVSRMFAEGRVDKSLLQFAKSFAGRQELRDVCFYRFCVAEPLMLYLVAELLLPAVGRGRIPRRAIREYLELRFPDSKSTETCSTAVLNALVAGGVVGTSGDYLTVAYRHISLPSFAFVMHSEFPEPGMYDIGLLENSRVVRAMLWNPDQIVPSLYELRNRGLLSKVSEIDTVRQFSVKWSLEELVELLIGGSET